MSLELIPIRRALRRPIEVKEPSVFLFFDKGERTCGRLDNRGRSNRVFASQGNRRMLSAG